MEILTPTVKKTLHDYTFTFETGMVLPLTVDLEAGDTIEFKADSVLVYLAAKPSLADPTKPTSAEDITILTKGLSIVQHGEREVEEPSQKDKVAWAEFVKSMSA